MQDGFFSSEQKESFIKRKDLPPKLIVKVPDEIKKEQKEVQIPPHPLMTLDVECYVNYFLIKFMRLSDRKFFYFEKSEFSNLNNKTIFAILNENEIVTFNGNKYDLLMVRLALDGASCKELKSASDKIIRDDLSISKFETIYQVKTFDIKHIDLIEIAPSVVSLKIYGGRLHCKRMQDLPIEEDAVLDFHDMEDINDYCGNDHLITRLLFLNLLPQIELRRIMSKQYKIDLMSKSDAQIAEEVIKSEIFKLTKKRLQKQELEQTRFYYKPPSFISFKSSILNKALDITKNNPFTVGGNGRITMPKELSDLQIKFGFSTYNMGMGGLHSMEKSAYHVEDDEYEFWDWDVDSYYPKIILNCKLYPKQIGKVFLDVYGKIVEERLQAKASGNKVKADSLKICVNGSFGKLGSPYSVLYAPDLMVQVTVTGQLSLLMLIENMEDNGIAVVSGNTDGIVLKCRKDKVEKMKSLIHEWEDKTGFVMSHSKYAGIFSRDINNYIAIKENGEVKLKGTFAPAGIAKNPENEICTIAMIEYLKKGTPFMETIMACKDITKFITIRSVKGGAVKGNKYLGKAIRWYHAKGETGSINYKTNNNQVPLTVGTKPIMNMGGELPDDIDYKWYEKKCHDLF